jgi:hypothetical protein
MSIRMLNEVTIANADYSTPATQSISLKRFVLFMCHSLIMFARVLEFDR